MTRDLIERLVSMQGVFGRNQGSGKDGDFGALVNLAADVAARNGKQVHVKLDVEPALLTLPDRLRRPVQSILAQLVRNAIIHGIEPPAARVSRDKPPVGSLVVTARRKNPKVLLFSVQDDGSGLNAELLRQRGIELGILPPDAPDALDREQTITLLCTSGFTTLPEPSPDGGRGVGLDAVKDLLSWLGGKIDVDTKAGQYTRFMVELPVQ
jgi:chemotaxis protein histidine kinase CheA